MNDSILIFDNDNPDRAKAMAKALNQGGARTIISYKGVFHYADGNVCPAPDFFDLVLWHKTNEDAFTDAKLNAGCTISFSGDSDADIPRALSANDALTEGEVRHIVEALKAGSQDLKTRLFAYWGAHRVARYAFRLLCEAWLLNRDRNEMIINACQMHGAIVVHAPVEPDQWFTPFGLKSSETEAPRIIGEQMGKAATKVTEFLVRVAQTKQASKQVSFSDYERDIELLSKDLLAAS